MPEKPYGEDDARKDFDIMEIKDLGQDTFLVGRKVIKADVSGMFDLSKASDRHELVRISEGLYTDKFSPYPYGDLTVCALRPIRPADLRIFPDAKYDKDLFHFRHLHDGAKEILRKEFPEHASEI